MKYLSVCSGIEAATVAWHGLGWEAAAYSEIEAFPSAVLAHHYPDVPNVGDMTKFKEWEIGTNVDLLVGGTPCQSFSVAGLRKGLDDPRGNLMLTYLAIARQYWPRWLVWENVPGVLSSNRGLDFASLLRGMGELGYGFAYRVLDAQYFGVAQRRRRVFVVGYLGDWRSAAAVLFERHSLSGHPAPSREKRQAAPTIPSRSTAGGGLGTDFDCDGGVVQVCPTIGTGAPFSRTGNYRTETDAIVAMCLNAGGMRRLDAESETLLPVAFHPTQDPISSAKVCHSIGANSNATAAVMQPVGIFQDSEFGIQKYDSAGTLRAGRIPEHQMVMQPAIAWDEELNASVEQAGTLLRGGDGGRHDGVMTVMQVRRLTPVECERLQGFPDGYTAIPWRKKPADQCPDGPRYKALGNSMAVPVMAWIGKRIQEFEAANAS